MTDTFVDTNVLIYANPGVSGFSASARAELAKLEGVGDRLWISRQVIREYVSVVTRTTGSKPASMTFRDAAAAVEDLLSTYRIAEDTSLATLRLVGFLREDRGGGRLVHDANIVATMLANGIRRVLTYNAHDFERFADLIELVPIDRSLLAQ